MTDKIEIDIRNIPLKKLQELCEKTKLLKYRTIYIGDVMDFNYHFLQ